MFEAAAAAAAAESLLVVAEMSVKSWGEERTATTLTREEVDEVGLRLFGDDSTAATARRC